MAKTWKDLSDKEKEKALRLWGKGKTAKEVAKVINASLKGISSSMSRIQPKGMGKGGKRKGSGNKPGIRFCGECRKKLENCSCE